MAEAAGTTVSLKLLIQAVDKASKTVASIQKQLNEASKSAVNFSKQSEDSAKKSKKGFDDTGKSVATLTERIAQAEKATAGFGKIGLKLTGFAAAVATPFGLALKSSSDFESSMSKVLAVTDGAAGKFEELKNVAGELGRTTKFTAREAAEGMTYLGQAGFDANEVISGIGPSLTLAIAAAVDLGQAANIASNVLSGMRLPISELTNVVDVMAKTAAESNAELLDMADAMSYAGPVAAATGVSMEELATLVGILGNAGIQGSRAGTALRGTLFALTAPSNEAKEALKDLGVQIKFNADGSINLIDIFHDLASAGLSAGDANKIFGRYATAAVLAINGQIDAMDKMLESNYAAAGAAKEMADIMHHNLHGAFTQLTSALDGLKRAFGDALLAPMTHALHSMASLVTAATELAQELPVTVSVIGFLAKTLISVSTALAGVAFAIASVNGALKFLQSEISTTAKVFVVNKIIATRSAIIALGASITTWTGIVGVARAAWEAFTGAIKRAWAAMLAHPIVAIIAIVSALVLVLAEWYGRVDKLIKQNRKLAAELGALNDNVNKQVKALGDLDEGSRKYQASALKLRKELTLVAENQEELAEQATAAAQSIDSLSGEFVDGGEAMREFQEASKALELEAIQKQVELLSEKMRRATGSAGLLNQATVGLSIGFKSLFATITGGDIAAPYLEAQKEAEKFEKFLKGAAGEFINRMRVYEDVDMSASLEEMYFFFTEVRGMTDKEASLFVEKFQEMQDAAKDTAETSKELEQLDLADLTAKIDETIVAVKGLNEEYENTIKVSEDAARSVRAGGSKDAAKEAYDARIQANKNLLAEEKKLNQELNALKRGLSTATKDLYDEEIADIERRNKLGFIKEWEYAQGKADIEARFSESKRRDVETLIQYAINSGARELDIYTSLTENKKALDREVLRSSKSAADQRIIHANQVKDAVLKIEQDIATATAELQGNEKVKIAVEQEQEIANLRKQAADAGIKDVSLLARAEAAIKAKYRRQELEYDQEILEAKQDAEVSAAQRRADAVAEKLEESFRKRQISPEQYVNTATEAQTKAIDAEIEILQQRLEYAQNVLNDKPLVIQIKAQIDELGDEKSKVEAEQAQKLRDAQLAAQAQELQMQQRLKQGDLDNMTARTASQEEMINARLELMRNGFAQELIQMEQAGANAVEIERRKQQQITKITKEGEQLRNDAMKSNFDLYAEMASNASSAFGDLYEASGKEVKEFFYLQKAAKIAETIMSTQSSAMTAYEAGPYAGPILAALVYAKGAAAIAAITAQKLAEGGLVGGSSPHSKADNIPAWLTAKEYVQPVDAVSHYGLPVMNAIRKKLIPKEVFTGYALPVQRMPRIPRRRFAEGGEVQSTAPTGSMNRSGDSAQGAAEDRNISIVNMVDPSMMQQFLSSTSGKNVLFNVLRSNSYELRNAMAMET
jgi:TP901 family phage tail tape measure protein